jgi:hypothetical protein
MYIEFNIPMDMSNPGLGLLCIRKDVQDWSQQHSIMYKEKFVKSVLRIIFDDVKTYSFFALTWDPKYTSAQYRLVEPMAPPPK